MKSIKKLAQSGFSHIELLIILVVVAALVGVGVLVYKNNSTSHAGGSNYHYLTTVTRSDGVIAALFGCYQPPTTTVASSAVSSAASSSNAKAYQHINILVYLYSPRKGGNLPYLDQNFELRLTDYYQTAGTSLFNGSAGVKTANLTLTDVNNVTASKAFAQVTLTSQDKSVTNFRFPYKQVSFYCSTPDPASSAIVSSPASSPASYVASSTVSAPVSVYVTQQ